MGRKSCEAMHVIAVLSHVPQEQQSRDAPGADIGMLLDRKASEIAVEPLKRLIVTS